MALCIPLQKVHASVMPFAVILLWAAKSLFFVAMVILTRRSWSTSLGSA